MNSDTSIPQMSLRVKAMLCVALLALSLAGCVQHPVLCNDGTSHTWTRWTDDYKEPNSAGFMRQRRYCEKCGAVEVEFHQ